MTIGLNGMRAAETRVAIRAVNIANAISADAPRYTPVQTAIASQPVVRAQLIDPKLTAKEGPFGGLAEDLVDMRLGLHAYRASAAVVRTGAELSRTLLDTLA